MTRKQRARRSAIITELSILSRDGWRHAKPCDYEPLERELAELEGRRREADRIDGYDRDDLGESPDY